MRDGIDTAKNSIHFEDARSLRKIFFNKAVKAHKVTKTLSRVAGGAALALGIGMFTTLLTKRPVNIMNVALTGKDLLTAAIGTLMASKGFKIQSTGATGRVSGLAVMQNLAAALGLSKYNPVPEPVDDRMALAMRMPTGQDEGHVILLKTPERQQEFNAAGSDNRGAETPDSKPASQRRIDPPAPKGP
jgi:hypothetical protein